MRKIKFRAWDKQDRRMITHEQDFIPLKVTNLGVLRLNPNIEKDNWEFMDRDRFYLMQSTGLKDRNGKEIYEGDIVRLADRDAIIKKVRFCNLRSKFEFVTIKECMENIIHGKLEGININNASWHEVIGNIYENRVLVV